MSVTVDVDTGHVHPLVAKVERFFGISARAQ